VMARIGLGYEAVRGINPRIVYGTVSGYGTDGPWAGKPGQDLLVQSISGMAWLNGNKDEPPMPMALSVADSFAGIHLVQGILACLLRRGITGEGGLVEASLLESGIDLQFELFSTFLNDGHKPPNRSGYHNAHAYLRAPYGIYKTGDGFIALAMGSVIQLGQLLEIDALETYQDEHSWFTFRDDIKRHIGVRLAQKTTAHWIKVLSDADFWCSDVYTWANLITHPGFKALDFVSDTSRPGTASLLTTRCPIRVDGRADKSAKWAPVLGEDTDAIIRQFQLSAEEQKS